MQMIHIAKTPRFHQHPEKYLTYSPNQTDFRVNGFSSLQIHQCASSLSTLLNPIRKKKSRNARAYACHAARCPSHCPGNANGTLGRLANGAGVLVFAFVRYYSPFCERR